MDGLLGKDLRAGSGSGRKTGDLSDFRVGMWLAWLFQVIGCQSLCLIAGAAGISLAATIPSPNVQQIVQRSEQAIATDWSHAPEAEARRHPFRSRDWKSWRRNRDRPPERRERQRIATNACRRKFSKAKNIRKQSSFRIQSKAASKRRANPCLTCTARSRSTARITK